MTTSRTPLLSTCDVYDVAQLAGGLPRVVDTAVAALVERGRLRVDGTGRLEATGTAVHPVEAAVLHLVGPRPRRAVTGLRLRAQEEPRLTAVAERLVGQGLLRRNPVAGLSSRWPAHLCTAAGRRVLTAWRAAPSAGTAVAVALAGPAGLADRVLRETLFPAAARPAEHSGRRADVATVDSGSSWWLPGGWAGSGADGGGCGGCGGFGDGGFGDGGFGDGGFGGGGFGGGDGGCGGGDGGGGC